MNRGLLAARRRCSCGNQMVLRDDKSDDGYHWECPVNQCRKRRSIRAGSFFEDSKIPLWHWLYIIFLWSIDESNKKVSLLTGLSLRTVITALQRFRDIYSLKILHGNLKLGGQGKTIEIDRNQETGESFDTYLTALKALAKTCNFGSLKDELIRDRIVCGIPRNLNWGCLKFPMSVTY